MNELSSFVYGLRLIERGVSAGGKLWAVLNLPSVLSTLAFHQQEKKLLSAATSTGEKTMNDAAKGCHTVQGQKSFDNEHIAESKRHSLPTAKTCKRKLGAVR
ncbi:hypothetical protein TNIN_454011 [Trichonephila inaurata madagascariensis]|uniref:Uncharacterized protein n=1 Tax=Trichonephila inaurata madagascariensis TaxID=2747483 RepID=A0A8X7BRJ9_9ARAC|nr:hypothetical protein TNIN_454011 [Trichonephila inaurata madagascariensis]